MGVRDAGVATFRCIKTGVCFPPLTYGRGSRMNKRSKSFWQILLQRHRIYLKRMDRYYRLGEHENW